MKICRRTRRNQSNRHETFLVVEQLHIVAGKRAESTVALNSRNDDVGHIRIKQSKQGRVRLTMPSHHALSLRSTVIISPFKIGLWSKISNRRAR